MKSCLNFDFYLQSNAEGIQSLGIVLSIGFCWAFYKMEQKPSMIKEKKKVTLLMCNYSKI